MGKEQEECTFIKKKTCQILKLMGEKGKKNIKMREQKHVKAILFSS